MEICRKSDSPQMKNPALQDSFFCYIGNFVPYIKTLRADAHSRETEICRKRPRSAQECALHILYSIIVNSIKQLTTV